MEELPGLRGIADNLWARYQAKILWPNLAGLEEAPATAKWEAEKKVRAADCMVVSVWVWVWVWVSVDILVSEVLVGGVLVLVGFTLAFEMIVMLMGSDRGLGTYSQPIYLPSLTQRLYGYADADG